MAQQRQYWVVSPNVKNDPKTVPDWKQETLRGHVAIMGWSPDDYGHLQQGPKFAGKSDRSIQRDDIVLIARRHRGEPDIVGFGIVKEGEYEERRFPHASDDDVYLRCLEPFKPLGQAPKGIPFLDVLPRNRALVQLHPATNGSHNKVCKWMERQLGSADDRGRRTSMMALPEPRPAGYEFRTKDELRIAKRTEAQLLSNYGRWLKKQGRQLLATRFERLQCDGWEETRKNLVEAKGSTKREDIRMAVGELLDYAFQMREKCERPNMAILLPKQPDADRIEWLPNGIKVIWRSGRSFLDNAGGQFL